VAAHVQPERRVPIGHQPRLEAARRITTFDEVTGGLDNAIVKLGTGEGQYEIDYDYSKGCGLCVAECPSGAIEMKPEPS
jgi:Pyruvate/2-oxoacid:ferredoxin oxidoreductase delta subunit